MRHERIAAAFRAACAEEIGALKPGKSPSGQLPISSPRSSDAADHPDPSVNETSIPSIPKRPRIASAASSASAYGSVVVPSAMPRP